MSYVWVNHMCFTSVLAGIIAEIVFSISLSHMWFLQSTEFSETPSPDSDSVNSVEGHSEPSWFKDIKFDDSDTEQIAEEGDDNLTSEFSVSLFSERSPPTINGKREFCFAWPVMDVEIFFYLILLKVDTVFSVFFQLSRLFQALKLA